MKPKSPKAAGRPKPWPRETREVLRKRAAKILALLKREYPTAHCELDFETPYQLLVAYTMTSNVPTTTGFDQPRSGTSMMA